MTGTTTTVIAERAPIGVLLWPVRAPHYAPNFTLARVEVVHGDESEFVRWTYQSGTVRLFKVGERVGVQIPAAAALV